MIRRALAWILFVLALVAAGRDGLLYWETGAYRAVKLGDVWYAIHPNSLQLIQPAIERHIFPAAGVGEYLWQSLISPLLYWPAWAVLAGFAVVLAVLSSRRRRRKWRSGSLG